MNAPLIIAPYFMDYILPFVLVFTLVFAILQKTKLLGDESMRVNTLIGAVVGLFLIAFSAPRNIIVLLMPFMAVGAVILLVFMLLYGFISGAKEGDVLNKWWKGIWIAILAISMAIFLVYITGYYDFVFYYLFGAGAGVFWVNLVLIAAIIGAIVAVLWGERK